MNARKLLSRRITLSATIRTRNRPPFNREHLENVNPGIRLNEHTDADGTQLLGM